MRRLHLAGAGAWYWADMAFRGRVGRSIVPRKNVAQPAAKPQRQAEADKLIGQLTREPKTEAAKPVAAPSDDEPAS